MGTLFISEHTAGSVAGTQVLAEPCITEQTVPIGVLSQASDPFSESTRIVRVHTDSICSIKFGKAGVVVATGSNKRMVAGQTECFNVLPGYEIAVIANT